MAQVASVAAGLALVRLLPAAAFGAYSLATTTLGLAGIIADVGLDAILTREIATHPSATAHLLRQAALIRVSVSLLVVALLVLVATVTSGIGTADLLLIGGFSLVPRGLARTVAAALTGLGRVRDAARIEAVSGVSSAGLSIALVSIILLSAQGGDDWGRTAAAAISALVIGNTLGLAAAWWWRPRPADAATTPPPPLSALLMAGLPFVLVGLAGAAFQALDIYAVNYVHWTGGTPDALALYAAPFRILNVLLLVPTAWGVAALPRYALLMKDDPAALRARLRRDVGQSAGIGIALSVGCTLFAAPLTQIGLGAAYAPAAPILALVGWMSLPVCLSAPAIALLTAANRQQRIVVSVLITAALSLGANVAWGWLAAAGQLDTVPRLLGVAAIKVALMSALLGLYWLSARGALRERG